jgi:peptide/nickel transport system permease protein
MKKPELLFGAAVLLAVLLMALFAPWLAPFDPQLQNLEERLAPPSWSHLCGLDELGRDILSRLVYGTRISVMVGLSVVLLAGLVGTLLGAVAGYFGGRVDALLMRVSDVFLAFPGILLAIALVAVLGPALRNVIFALVIIGWVGYARLVRGQVLQIREAEFVASARVAGASWLRILGLHILPEVLPVLTVQASLGMAGAILSEAGLSFLGLGIQPPTSSWGAMINAGRSHLLDAPHLALFPGLAILVTVMGLNFLGDGLVNALDPHGKRQITVR